MAAFTQHSVAPGNETVSGYALAGRTLVTWGTRLLWRSLPQGNLRVLRGAGRAFSEGGCLTDVDGDGQLDVVVSEGSTLVWFRAPGWSRHVIDEGIDAPDLIPATLHGRRGILLIHKRIQIRFYQIPDPPTARWPAHDLYSIYTPAWQGGLEMADVDGDGRPDILCGNYWMRSPERFGLPWRLFAINTWTEEEPSGMLRLKYRRGILYAAQREMAEARLAWFERPPDPREQWPQHRLDEGLHLNRPNALDVSDFDGNSRPDILVAEQAGEERILIFRNEGGGHYRPEVVARGAGARFACAADLNGDGRPDILVIGRNGAISWWENRPPRTR